MGTNGDKKRFTDTVVEQIANDSGRPAVMMLRRARNHLRGLWKRHTDARTDDIKKLGEWLSEGVIGLTVLDAREQIVKWMAEGHAIICPVCNQTVKAYPRHIYIGMAIQLMRIYWGKKHYEDGWVPVQKIYLDGGAGDYAKLRFWGLIERMDARTGMANSSGFWRITDAGESFLRGELKVAKTVYIYNNRKVGEDFEDGVTIRQALTDSFDYETLMKPEMFDGQWVDQQYREYKEKE